MTRNMVVPLAALIMTAGVAFSAPPVAAAPASTLALLEGVTTGNSAVENAYHRRRCHRHCWRHRGHWHCRWHCRRHRWW
jgi:hypothetical protein